MFNWFLESNRYKHFMYAIPCGMIGTILFVLGLAVGMEYKDVLWGGRWDWVDFICTIIGGLIGNIITFLIILLFI